MRANTMNRNGNQYFSRRIMDFMGCFFDIFTPIFGPGRAGGPKSKKSVGGVNFHPVKR